MPGGVVEEDGRRMLREEYWGIWGKTELRPGQWARSGSGKEEFGDGKGWTGATGALALHRHWTTTPAAWRRVVKQYTL